jgi:hypothetical protein
MSHSKEDRTNNGNVHPTRIFKTPEELLKAWEEYKKHLKTESFNWPKVQYVGRDGERKEDYPVLPYILDGFQVWYYQTKGRFIHQYFDNKDGYYDDFVGICSYIRQDIKQQQVTGGMLNLFNPSITQRLNNLKDSTDVTSDGKPLTPQPVTYNLVKPKDEE